MTSAFDLPNTMKLVVILLIKKKKYQYKFEHSKSEKNIFNFNYLSVLLIRDFQTDTAYKVNCSYFSSFTFV